jgi:hypothetical protein
VVFESRLDLNLGLGTFLTDGDGPAQPDSATGDASTFGATSNEKGRLRVRNNIGNGKVRGSSGWQPPPTVSTFSDETSLCSWGEGENNTSGIPTSFSRFSRDTQDSTDKSSKNKRIGGGNDVLRQLAETEASKITSQTHQSNYYSHSVRHLHGDENGAGERTEGIMREGMRMRDARRKRTNTTAANSTGAHSGGTASTYTRAVAVQMPSAGAALGHHHTYLDLDLNRFSGHADACIREVGENTDYSLVGKGEVLDLEEEEEKLERVERAAELDDLLDLMGCS